ncbi:MAG: hypothetical protein FWE59_05370 [Oscillospiraceae bacterium]|nr:hypothetical protein [Oscillospiraceae bacterium]
MEAFVVAIAVIQLVAFSFLTRYVLTVLARGRASLKAADGFQSREARLISLYGHVEELMDVFENYIEEVRQDVEKERAAMTEMTRQVASFVHADCAAPMAHHTAKDEGFRALSQPLPPVPPVPPHPDSKPARARALMGRGLPLGEVARELGIGTGEVRLIAELDRS